MAEDWAELWKLLAAVAAGALIGFERETHDKPAGFRTNILICLGAALFTVISVRLGTGSIADPTRIAAQIVTGVGFLGAGAIIQYRGNVIGLTTAATIWVVASVGMAFGAGAYFVGTIGAVLATAVLLSLSSAENLIARWRATETFEVYFQPTDNFEMLVERLVRDACVRRRAWRVSKTPQGVTGRLTVSGPARAIDRLQNAMMGEAEIRGFRRL